MVDQNISLPLAKRTWRRGAKLRGQTMWKSLQRELQVRAPCRNNWLRVRSVLIYCFLIDCIYAFTYLVDAIQNYCWWNYNQTVRPSQTPHPHPKKLGSNLHDSHKSPKQPWKKRQPPKSALFASILTSILSPVIQRLQANVAKLSISILAQQLFVTKTSSWRLALTLQVTCAAQ